MRHAGLTDAELELLTSPAPELAEAVQMPGDLSGAAPILRESDEVGADLPHASLMDLHRDFAEALRLRLSKFARRDVSVLLRDQSSGSYAQFVFGQVVPTCCAVVRARSIDLEFWLAFQPSILYPIMDRMLGSRESDPIPQRPLSEIESGLAMIILNDIITAYGDAWQRALSLELRVERLVHNVQQLGGAAGSEPTWRVRYGLQCGQDFGLLDFCIPWATSQQIRKRLAASHTS